MYNQDNIYKKKGIWFSQSLYYSMWWAKVIIMYLIFIYIKFSHYVGVL